MRVASFCFLFVCQVSLAAPLCSAIFQDKPASHFDLFEKALLNSQNVQDKETPLDSFNQETVRDLKRIFAKENLLISSAQPSTLRSQIVDQDGSFQFENAWHGHASNGNNSTDARGYTESIRFGMSLKQYFKTAPASRPFYGYLQFKSSFGHESDTHMKMDGYGDDIWLFKTTNENFTVTILDSFIDSNSPSSSLIKNKGLIKTVSGMTSVDGDPSVVYTSAQKSDYFLPYNENTVNWLIADRLRENPLPYRDLTEPRAEKISGNYYEVQLYGPHTLSDIEGFIFRKNPPSGSFLRILQHRKIPIWQWTDGLRAPVPWHAPAEAAFDAHSFLSSIDKMGLSEISHIQLSEKQLNELTETVLKTDDLIKIQRLIYMKQGEMIYLSAIKKALREKNSYVLKNLDLVLSTDIPVSPEFVNHMVALARNQHEPVFSRFFVRHYDLWRTRPDCEELFSKLTSASSLDQYSSLLISQRIEQEDSLPTVMLVDLIQKLDSHKMNIFLNTTLATILKSKKMKMSTVLETLEKHSQQTGARSQLISGLAKHTQRTADMNQSLKKLLESNDLNSFDLMAFFEGVELDQLPFLRSFIQKTSEGTNAGSGSFVRFVSKRAEHDSFYLGIAIKLAKKGVFEISRTPAINIPQVKEAWSQHQ